MPHSGSLLGLLTSLSLESHDVMCHDSAKSSLMTVRGRWRWPLRTCAARARSKLTNRNHLRHLALTRL